MRANAGGTTARLARRGHLSHGVNQIATPKASAIPYTAAIAVGFDPGAGSGRVTSPSTPAPAKNTAAKRPNSLRRSGGPWFSDEAPGATAGRPTGSPAGWPACRLKPEPKHQNWKPDERTLTKRFPAAPAGRRVGPAAPGPDSTTPACRFRSCVLLGPWGCIARTGGVIP